MKSQTLLSVLSTFFLLLTSLASAWPGVFDAARPGALLGRQNSESQAQSTSASQTQSSSNSGSATVTQTSGSSSSGSASVSRSGSSSASGSGSGSSSGSAKTTGSTVTGGSSSKNATTTAVDPRAPEGGVNMLTPAATDAATYLKVGDQITFVWNYTSLSVKPSYIDVVATNTVNSQTYTIAANQTWQSTQSVTWDTNQFTQTTDLPFVVATYTLMIYDAASEPTAAASAGYLGAYSQYYFGVYTPQPYTPLNEFRCATCNSAAMSLHEKQALSILLGTCTITILSFTWFASGVFHLF